MKTVINIDNYQEIMFQLLESDFDEETRIELLKQIESDELFKFEWEEWQKTKFNDPIENYQAESRGLNEKIVLIAKRDHSRRKMLIFFYSTAAIITLVLSIYLLTANYKPGTNHPAPVITTNPNTHPKQVIPSRQEAVAEGTNSSSHRKLSKTQKPEIAVISVNVDSSKVKYKEVALVKTPKVIDSVSITLLPIAKNEMKKPRYKVSIETVQLTDNHQQSMNLTQHGKLKLSRLFTNTQFILRRKSNGEPDKLILLGEENNYVCINLNY
jgi:hypothetical protein